MVNCHCARFHKPVTQSINEKRLEITYDQVSNENKNLIKQRVIDAKIYAFNSVITEIKNFDSDKCNDFELFKKRFKNSEDFHKIVTRREKAEMLFESCVIDKGVEKYYPAKRQQEFIIENLTDSDVATYHVRYEDRLGRSQPIYYTIYEYNLITGRNISSDYINISETELRNDYKKAIKKEIQAIMNDLNDDCSII